MLSQQEIMNNAFKDLLFHEEVSISKKIAIDEEIVTLAKCRDGFFFLLPQL